MWIHSTLRHAYHHDANGCKRNDSLSPRFGIAQITLPGGSSVYLKRQVRGLTYDELAISPDGDKCTPANPETDYIFDGLGAGAFPGLLFRVAR
jgi:hypothetical protein